MHSRQTKKNNEIKIKKAKAQPIRTTQKSQEINCKVAISKFITSKENYVF
jgi:hypothetical protein